jgi:nucleoside phosphorylase
MSPVAVLFALAREAMAFRRTFRRRERLRGAPCVAELCDGVLLLETGVGLEAAERALRWLLGTREVGLVVSAGFSGALGDDLRVGDLLWASEVVGPDGRAWATTCPVPAGPWRQGKAVTVGELLGTVEDKLRLHAEHGALAVDMESAVIVRRCREAGVPVPVAVLRAISDDGRTPLSPALLGALRGGRVAPGRLLLALLRRPALLGELLRLARDTRLAARRLQEGLAALLTARLSGGR